MTVFYHLYEGVFLFKANVVFLNIVSDAGFVVREDLVKCSAPSRMKAFVLIHNEILFFLSQHEGSDTFVGYCLRILFLGDRVSQYWVVSAILINFNKLMHR